MGDNFIVEEKDLRDYNDNHQCLGSFEDENSMFYGQENHHSLDYDLADENDDEDDDDDETGTNESQDMAERTIFWESQESLLQEILEHYSLTNSKLRQEIIRLVDIARDANFCNCFNPKSYDCSSCLRQRVVNLLSDEGFNATLCTSKWKKTQKFPGGTHEYIEVLAITKGRKKQIPFLIELQFRDEFKMAKACDEYQRLINQLPEIFIGKTENLNAIVRVACNAAKRSTLEKKIHMGPWRKRSFMQMKWSASQERQSLDQVFDNFKMISPRQGHIAAAVNHGLGFSTATAVEVA